MPKLVIDNAEVEVPEGTNVLEAAKKLGIIIPHFCYHDALGSVGACRLCAMKFIKGPVKGVQMSCMVKAQDGMVVSTNDGDAMHVRKMVIEWLMTNHPHDCPVCDEGGMCLLQDYTIAGGHGIRRYKGKKRTFISQYLGEFIEQEMNRCIQCYRCHRFYRDYAGGDDFGTKRIANQTFFGRFRDGWLESEFSGNLADVCPTGVFTDRTYRYKGRMWELETAPSVCPHCALGCNIIPGAKLRELVVVKARENLAVNGWFICDRGRFGYRFASLQDRPREFTVNGEEKTRDEAAFAAGKLLSDALAAHGPGGIAFMGSARTSLENNFALRKLAALMGTDNICYCPDPVRERKERRACSLLNDKNRRSLRDVEFSDSIIAVGTDPVNEAPMLALLMRQAARNGAKITAIDPRPVKLPFTFTHVTALPEEFKERLAELINERGERVTIICGTDITGFDAIDAAADVADKFNCGLFYTFSSANSFGAAVMAGGGPDFEDIITRIEQGKIKALFALESDPLGRYSDRERAARAFEKLDMLIAMDYLPTETAKAANVFLPTAAYAEMEGIFINNEGRAQAFGQAYIPGIPINTMGPKLHPPREFFRDVPGRSYPAWEYIRDILCEMKYDCGQVESVDAIRSSLMAEMDEFAPLAGIDPLMPGIVIKTKREYTPPEARPEQSAGLTLYAMDLTFGTEEIALHSDKTQLKAPAPYVLMNDEDARGLGLKDGGRVNISSEKISLSCELKTSPSCSKGAAFAPRLHGFDAAALSGHKVVITEAGGD